jgi:hypothetical protein
MNIFTITDHPDQQFGTIIDGKRVTIRLRYNPVSDRWSFDLSLDDIPKLLGRRIVTGVDLLAAFNFGIGVIFAASVTSSSLPDREALPLQRVKIFHATEAEVGALG